MGARRDARRAHRRHRVAAVRAGTGRLRGAAPDRREPRRARGRADRRARAGVRGGRPPCDRSRRARALRRRAARSAADRGGGPVLRRCRRARRARARRRRDPDAAAERLGAGRDRRRLSLARPGPRSAGDGVRRPRDPVRGRGAGAAACHRLRARARLAPALRLARRWPAGAVCLPPQPVLGADPLARGLRGGPAARARDRSARARGGRDGGAPRRAPAHRRRAARLRLPGGGGPRSGRHAAARALTVSSGRRSGTGHGQISRAADAVGRLLDELEGWERLGERVSREDLVDALERATVRAAAEPSAGESPSRTSCARERAASMSSSSSASRRAASPGGRPRRRSSTTISGVGSARASSGPTASPRPPPLLHRLRPRRRGASISSARRPRTTARHASRARSGTRSPSLFDPDDVTPLDAAAPAVGADVAARGGSDGARAPARARRARGRPRRARPARALARANGWERRLERALAAEQRQTRLRHPAVLALPRRARDVQRHRARAVRATAPRPGCSSGSSTRARSTRRSMRSCAARSRTRR